MTEDEYLAIVYRIQQAMAIEPFVPNMGDVIQLLDDWRHHEVRLRDALAVEHEIQRQMLERLGIDWTPGEPFYSLISAEIERLRARLTAAERLIEVVRARQIGTAGGVGAAFEAYDALDEPKDG